jgi:transposase-like protein
MTCIRCGSEATRKDGQTRLGGHCWRCHRWRRRFTARSMRAFTRHGFPDDVIGLAISWYVCYRLSSADVGAWFTERGLVVHHSTIYCWCNACSHGLEKPRGHTDDQWVKRGGWLHGMSASRGRGPLSSAQVMRMVTSLLPSARNGGMHPLLRPSSHRPWQERTYCHHGWSRIR